MPTHACYHATATGAQNLSCLNFGNYSIALVLKRSLQMGPYEALAAWMRSMGVCLMSSGPRRGPLVLWWYPDPSPSKKNGSLKCGQHL
eukprot:6214263-Pleurochrysis_carterae.AAC.3